MQILLSRGRGESMCYGSKQGEDFKQHSVSLYGHKSNSQQAGRRVQTNIPNTSKIKSE